MLDLDVILPAVIVLLAFVLRLVVDRTVDLVVFLEALFDLPIDIVLLAISFAAAVSITQPAFTSTGIILSLIFIIFLVVGCLLARRSKEALDQDHYLSSGAFCLANFVISSFSLFACVSFVTGRWHP